MAGVTTYEGTTVSVRWSWTVTPAGGSPTTSPWSVNTDDANCPSNFHPAPFVNLLRSWNLTAPPGGTYQGEIAGFVAHQYFFLELENPSGTVVYAQGQTANATNVTNVTIAYDCWCGRLSPGSYLVHIHNVIGSLLWSRSVTVTSPDGLTANLTANVTSGRAPLAVAFGASPSSGHPPYTYAWNFGDGNQSTLADPTHTFTRAGNYSVVLTVSDHAGNSVQVSVKITVTPSPRFALDVRVTARPGNGSAPLAVRLWANASGGAPPYSYLWSLGNGAVSTLESPVANYSSPGLYVAVVNVSDTAGDLVTGFVDIGVRGPGAGINASLVVGRPAGAAPLTSPFSVRLSGGVPPYTVRWTWGDGTPSANGTNATHTFSSAGNYSVTALVTDAIGENVTARTNVLVGAPLTVHLEILPGADVAGSVVSAYASLSGGGPGARESWLLDGRDASGSGPNFSFVPSLAGTYTISVHVTDSWGDASAASGEVVVMPAPVNSTHVPPPAAPATFAWGWVGLGVGIAAAVALGVYLWAVARRPGG
jgi:PKD repeat protein